MQKISGKWVWKDDDKLGNDNTSKDKKIALSLSRGQVEELLHEHAL